MMGRRSSGRSGGGLGWAACCLGFLLKLLAFLQAFAAVSAILYTAWILSRWARHHHLHLHDLLPDLWFPSAVMAAGLFYCLLLLAGYLAAEINTGCCLCFVRLPSFLPCSSLVNLFSCISSPLLSSIPCWYAACFILLYSDAC
uniref:Uncharacterized protein n=1 Tax=Arundo donax TaxID=35708 RepID=A0A0A9CF55_ARUDO